MNVILQKVRSFYSKRTLIERGAFFVTLILVAFLSYDWIVTPVTKQFKIQKRELAKLRQEYASVPTVLETYLGLSQRRELIEKKYRGVSFEGGVLSHIEKLVVDVAKIENRSDFKIVSKPEKEFGGSYIHEPLRIELTTTSMEDLTNFLGELVRGERPLVLTRLQFKKSNTTSKLAVQLDVSNFRRKT